MHRDLLAGQVDILREPVEALVADIDDSLDRIVAHVKSNLGL